MVIPVFSRDHLPRGINLAGAGHGAALEKCSPGPQARTPGTGVAHAGVGGLIAFRRAMFYGRSPVHGRACLVDVAGRAGAVYRHDPGLATSAIAGVLALGWQ